MTDDPRGRRPRPLPPREPEPPGWHFCPTCGAITRLQLTPHGWRCRDHLEASND